MATTMLSFLYQTHTIQRLARSTPTHLTFCSLLHTTSAHNFSTSSSHQRYPRSKEPRFESNDPIPFELPADLAADPRFNPPPGTEFEEASTGPEAAGTITPKERRAFDDIFKEIASTSPSPNGDAVPAAGSSSSASSPPGGMLASLMETPSDTAKREHSIISSIIGDASQNLLSSKKSPHHDLLRSMRQLHNIDPLGRNDGSAMSTQERYDKLLSFPPSLRNAAKRALGILKPGAEEQPVDGPFEEPERRHPEHMPLDWEKYMAGQQNKSLLESETPQMAERDIGLVEAEQLSPASNLSSEEHESVPSRSKDSVTPITEAHEVRQRERVRLHALMSQTKTDFELWDVLERDVFSIVSRLGLDEAAKSRPRRGKKRKMGTLDTTGSPAVSGSQSQSRLDLIIHGPLYSSHLVSGLVSMDQRYPGSPLALSILPRVKAMGLTSYILGASVDLYTAQMKIHWNRYRDVRAVLDLMDEMRSAELGFDHKHLRMVEQMENSILRCVSGQRGDALANIFATPEWAALLATRIQHIKKWIYTDLKKREEPRHQSVSLPEEISNLRYASG